MSCECCDHPLEHAIKDALNYYQNAVPPLTPGVVFSNLEDALEQWQEATREAQKTIRELSEQKRLQNNVATNTRR